MPMTLSGGAARAKRNRTATSNMALEQETMTAAPTVATMLSGGAARAKGKRAAMSTMALEQETTTADSGAHRGHDALGRRGESQDEQ
jgi:outer membrane murein-binding lipoprotein Lpp